MDTMGADFWRESESRESESQELVGKLREALKEEHQLKIQLLELKKMELQDADGDHQEYLQQLEKKWQAEAELLSVVLFAKDSPFNFEWAKNDEDWTDKIFGLKEALPIKSKNFVKDMQNYFERSKKEFNYN